MEIPAINDSGYDKKQQTWHKVIIPHDDDMRIHEQVIIIIKYSENDSRNLSMWRSNIH